MTKVPVREFETEKGTQPTALEAPVLVEAAVLTGRTSTSTSPTQANVGASRSSTAPFHVQAMCASPPVDPGRCQLVEDRSLNHRPRGRQVLVQQFAAHQLSTRLASLLGSTTLDYAEDVLCSNNDPQQGHRQTVRNQPTSAAMLGTPFTYRAAERDQRSGGRSSQVQPSVAPTRVATSSRSPSPGPLTSAPGKTFRQVDNEERGYGFERLLPVLDATSSKSKFQCARRGFGAARNPLLRTPSPRPAAIP